MCATVWRNLVKATEVTAGLAESNGNTAECMTYIVTRDHLRAQRSVTSLEKLYLFS